MLHSSAVVGSLFDSSYARNQAIHETVKKLGNINILINNAGVNRRRSSARSNREVWDSVMDINLRACMHTTRTALPYMMQNKDGGFIIYISSIGASKNHLMLLSATKLGKEIAIHMGR